VSTLTEIYLFASNLSLSAAGDDSMVVSVSISGIEGRQIYSEDPARGLMRQWVAHISEFGWTDKFSRESLRTHGRELAVTKARDLLDRFGSQISLEILRDIQHQTRRISS
jgi:hypothetical protein